MTCPPSDGRGRIWISALILMAGLPAASSIAVAQGCMPIRYTSATLSTERASALYEAQGDVGVVYRWLHADRFYVGHTYSPQSAPGGMPSRININTAEFHASYAPTSRLSVTLGLPVAAGSVSSAHGDGLRHEVSAAGLGDMSLVGTMWLADPPDHAEGNMAVGLGMKVPTGRHDAQAAFYTSATTTELRSIDPSIQLGDGGWGIVFQSQAFRQVVNRTAAYVAGTYLANAWGHTNITAQVPYGVVKPLAVTDEYSAHAGLTFDALPQQGWR
jgi:hypothetical protein